MRYALLMLALLCMTSCGNTIRGFLGIPSIPTVPAIPEWSAGLDALFLYSYAFCIVIMAACIAVLFWVQIPSLRNWAWLGLTFAASLMGMGIVFAIIKPFIPFIVLGSCALGAMVGVWYIIANFDTLKEFVHNDKPDLSPSALRLVEACEKIPPKK